MRDTTIELFVAGFTTLNMALTIDTAASAPLGFSLGLYDPNQMLMITGGDLIVGNTGGGEVGQAGANAIVQVNHNLILAASGAGSSANYTMGQESQVPPQLNVLGNAYVGGNATAAGGTASLNIGAGTVTVNGTLKIWNTPNTIVNLAGATLNVGTLDTNGHPERFLGDGTTTGWTGGTLNITGTGGLTIDNADPSPLGSSLTISGTQSLRVPNGALTIGSSGTGALTQSGGTVRSAELIIGSVSASVGSYTMNNAAATLIVNGDELIASGATGTSSGGTITQYGGSFSQSAGTHTITGGLLMGLGGDATGCFTLSGGALAVNTSNTPLEGEIIGWEGIGSFIQSGGTNTVGTTGNNNESPVLIVGYSSGKGTYTLSDGSATINGSAAIGDGDNITGVLNISGGSMTVTQTLAIENTTNTSVTLSNTGTLSVGSLETDPANFNWTGGTLNITGSGGLTVDNTGDGTSPLGSAVTLGSTHTLGVTNTLTIGTGGAVTLSGGTLNVGSAVNGPANTLTIGTGGSVALSGGTLSVGTLDTGGTPLRLNWTGGTLNITGSGGLTVDNTTASPLGSAVTLTSSQTLGVTNTLTIGTGGAVTLSGGTLNVGSAVNGPANSLTIGTGGSVALSGGTLNAGTLDTGRTPSRLNWTGGTLHLTNQFLSISSSGPLGPALTLGSGMTLSVDQGEVVSGGTVTQTGGTNQMFDNTGLLVGESSPGVYNLSGAASLSAPFLEVGEASTGTFNQMGGTATSSTLLEVGGSPGGSGTYLQSGGTCTADDFTVGSTGATGIYILSGSASLSATYEDIGDTGGLTYATVGTFTQNGGTNTTTELDVVPGTSGSGNGAYNLNSGTLTSATITVKSGGTFHQTGGTLNFTTFNQTGGTAAFDPGLTVDSALYTLSGGSLAVGDNEVVGDQHTAAFVQSGGTHTIGSASNPQSLFLGGSAGGIGTYELDAPGTLTVYNGEFIGSSGQGTFTQNGGTNQDLGAVGMIIANIAGSHGTYNMNGGSLSVTSGMELGFQGIGIFTQTGGTVTMLSTLRFGNQGNGAYSLSGTGSLTVNGDEILGNLGIGSFTQSGGTHVVTGTLTLANLNGSSGSYALNGGTLIAASITVNSNGTFHQTGGTLGFATFNQTGGSASFDPGLTVDSALYTLSGGNMTSGDDAVVGNQHGASFVQSGGNHTIGAVSNPQSLILGNSASAIGTYELDDPGTLTVNGGEFIGNAGQGTFTQNGGTNQDTVPQGIAIALSVGSHAAYNMNGGTLSSVGGIDLGFQGVGSFTQTGGTVTMLSTVTLASQSTGNATYTLNGSSAVMQASAGVYVGGNSVSAGGTGTLNVQQGSMTVAGAMTVWNHGTVNYSGGTLGLTSLSLVGGGRVNMIAGTGRVLTATTIAVDSASQLDVADNKLIVHNTPVGAWNGSNYDGITGMIKSGRNGGGWNGGGIVTSMTAAGSSSLLTTLAVATAGEVGKTTFGGQSVSSTDVLVMYTYAGDANLDGKINADDYFEIDSHYNQGANVAANNAAKSYFHGDFNYDGKIDGDDYFLIDQNFHSQGSAFGGDAPLGVAGVSAVPEPTAFGAAAILLVSLSGRRRRPKTL